MFRNIKGGRSERGKCGCCWKSCERRLRSLKNDSQISHDICENTYWLALQDKQWIIPTNVVVKYYLKNNSLKNLFYVSHFDLSKLGLEDNQIRKFINFSSKLDYNEINKIFHSFEKNGIELIRYIDDNFPNTLRSIKNPPLMIFKKGNLSNFNDCIAISGTRNPSHYGRIMARKFAYNLANKGFTILSGLAHGIDEWAHSGALEAKKGKTIAVIAWMNPEYPSEHTELIKDIMSRGAIISEVYLRPESRIARAKFVQRNRIISGLSDFIIAIESDEEGGTVHQVRLALEQGKIVFALEPKSNMRAKRGFKVFLNMGAYPIKSFEDIIKTIKDKYIQSTFPKEIFQKKLLKLMDFR